MAKYIAAAIQMASTKDIDENLQEAGRLLDGAAAKGAKLAVLPEYLHRVAFRSREAAETVPGGQTFQFFSEKAKQLNIWILGGTVFEKNGNQQPFNTTMLIAPDGTLAAKYRKAHLYDVSVPGCVPVQESANMAHGGEKPLVIKTEELGNLGLTICYDVRFPEVYRLLALDGAEVLFVPADFGFVTGRAHREVLLRARALENGCYVIAPQQCHKKSCGETMIIDPWGTVVAKMDMEPGVITAEIDTDMVHSTRDSLGLFSNRRPDLYDIQWKSEE